MVTDPLRLVLVFGPSGGGKSTTFAYLRPHFPQLDFVSLDELTCELGRARHLIGLHDHAEALWVTLYDQGKLLPLGIEALTSFLAVQSGRRVVVDVGAGFLEEPGCHDWLSEHLRIAFVAPPAALHARICAARHEPRTLAEFTQCEFSAARMNSYQKANFQLNADCAPPELARRFVLLLRSVGVLTDPHPT